MKNVKKIADTIFKTPTKEELLVRSLEIDQPSDYHFTRMNRNNKYRLVTLVDFGDNNEWKLLKVHQDGLEIGRVVNNKPVIKFKNFNQIKELRAYDKELIWDKRDFPIDKFDFQCVRLDTN